MIIEIGMRKTKWIFSLFIALAIVVAACNSDDDFSGLNDISGKLVAGENVTTDDLGGLLIYLARINDGVKLDDIKYRTEAIELVESMETKVDGSFAFQNLKDGNYYMMLQDDFLFAVDTFKIFTIDGTRNYNQQLLVDRISQENFTPPPPPGTWVPGYYNAKNRSHYSNYKFIVTEKWNSRRVTINGKPLENYFLNLKKYGIHIDARHSVNGETIQGADIQLMVIDGTDTLTSSSIAVPIVHFNNNKATYQSASKNGKYVQMEIAPDDKADEYKLVISD